jgi:hypothetical protein
MLKKSRIFVCDPGFFQDPRQKKIDFFLKTIFFSKKFQNLKFVMQSGPCESKLLMVIFFVCYCMLGVYFVTGTKNPDKKSKSRITK